MYTSVVLVALSGYLAQGAVIPERPSWMDDYSLACKRGLADGKPLAVFIGSGNQGWEKLSKSGTLGKEVKRLLEDHYVCVYIDTSRRTGRQLAEDFDCSERVGLVLSDHTGKVQAFRHEGELKNSELERYLRKYADPTRVARITESPEVQDVVVPYRPPVQYYAPAPSFGGGRSC